ncbi:ankyrin repeat and sterile alpha motif domain-containing protein 1b, partial [Plakobranchus ocellatus]
MLQKARKIYLAGNKSKYADILKRHGFDNTLFIKALTEKELIRMGIVKRGHVQFLLAQIALLPAFEIEYQVPTNVKDWLSDIGLIMYRENFRRNHIRTPKEMEILKRLDRKDIARELGITKEGHIKRLLFAIRMLRDPSEVKLVQLRNSWLTILAVSNTLWLILISTLAAKADLTVIGANPV